MDDPRYNEANDEEILTEDSADELKDLVKEFEAKYEKIQQQKKLKKRQNQEIESETSETEIEASITEATPKFTPGYNQKARTVPQKPISNSKGKHDASKFINKLYATNYKEEAQKYQRIDYDKRKFAFESIETHKPLDLEVDELEPLSNQFLRKRYISKDSFKSIIDQTDPELKYLRIDKLFAKINRTNNYLEPMYNNWCLVGMVRSKSTPKTTKDNKKFLKVSIGDFQRSVDLMLFNSAFNQYWKLRVGDVIVILNPVVSKYHFETGPKGESKSGFTLKLDDNGKNSIIEIGSTRDFGRCSFVKKSDNTKCEEIINVKKTDMCDFHVDLKFKANSNKRMELNGSVHMKSPRKSKQSVYLSSTNHSVGGSNLPASTSFIKYESINEATNVYHRQSDLFRNPDKYHDPTMLQNTAEKRRKIKDQNANKALEAKLARLSNNTTFKNLNLIKEDKIVRDDPNKLMAAKQRGFPNSMLSKIGFDPTVNYHTNEDTSPTKEKNKLERVKELYALSNQKAKERTLTTSLEDRQSKQQKWQLNSNNLKQYKERVDSHDINGGKKRNIQERMLRTSPRKRKNIVLDEDEGGPQRINPSFMDSDTDSDIDIEFDTEEMKQAYQNKISNN